MWQVHLEKKEMKEYLNDTQHLIMEPLLLILHLHKELFSHFGSKPNFANPNYERIRLRNMAVSEMKSPPSIIIQR
jgi:hypothetical protein